MIVAVIILALITFAVFTWWVFTDNSAAGPILGFCALFLVIALANVL